MRKAIAADNTEGALCILWRCVPIDVDH